MATGPAKPVPAKPTAPVKAAVAPQSKPKPVAPAAKRAATAVATTIAAPVKAVTAAVKDQTMDEMKQTAETMTAKAQTMFADASARAKSTVEKGQQFAGEMNDFTKGNVDALVESAKIAARGLETMGQDAAAYARASFERTSATVRQMASVKSPTELMKLQSDYVRTSFDAMVAEGSRGAEAMLKLAGEVAQPISNRIALAAEKVKQAA